MGFVGVSLCDMCGKRTDKFAGKLILFQDVKLKKNCGYKSQITARSWKVCKSCLNRITAMQTARDKIKEELEIKLDEIRIKNRKLELLG